MKVLITGASGMIGGEVLLQCLDHPIITKVVAFSRRPLTGGIFDHPKFECVVVQDFAEWPEFVLRAHLDAAAMIWAMGSYPGNRTVDFEYPATFIESMIQVLKEVPNRPKFRWVQLSGKFVRQNQEQNLWFLDEPRKLKGLLETKALALAENHTSLWETLIVKPGGVIPRTMVGNGFIGLLTSMSGILGENWSVQVDQLGAFMTYLAISGKGESPVSENKRIVTKGTDLLQLAEIPEDGHGMST